MTAGWVLVSASKCQAGLAGEWRSLEASIQAGVLDNQGI